MLIYSNRVEFPATIPYTQNRYEIDVVGHLRDVLTNTYLSALPNGNYDLPGTIYGDRWHVSKLVAMAYKPLYVNVEQLEEFELVQHYSQLDKPFLSTFDPRYFHWVHLDPYGKHVPIKGPSMYPEGFYRIPMFTRYLANEKGEIISTMTGQRLSDYLEEAGYKAMRVVRDDDKSVIMKHHQLIALAFHGVPPPMVRCTVDHINGVKTDNHPENLEWVEHAENVRRAYVHDYHDKRSKTVFIKNVETGEQIAFPSVRKVAQYFNVRDSSIFVHLHSANPNAVFKRTHLIWYDDGKPREITDEHRNARAGSQKIPVLVKNLVDGSITEWESGTAFQLESGLSRKQVFETLKRRTQKRYGDIIFKYKTDANDWVR